MKNKQLFKKATQLPLSSMSEHWKGNPEKKSGKHRSQEMQAARQRVKRKNKKPLFPLGKIGEGL
jgi:hypothetical protein